jgi:hypothetical protein
MCSLTGIVGLGAATRRRPGRLEAAPGDAALPAHGLDREQHLLTIRTPRTTSSEIAVALVEPYRVRVDLNDALFI